MAATFRWPAVFVVWCLITDAVHAQVPDTAYVSPYSVRHDELTLLAGYAQGLTGVAELGIGRTTYGVTHHPYSLGYHVGVEARVDRPERYGVKAGVFLMGGAAFGLQVVQYFHDGGITVLRPELGVGLQKVKLTARYDIRLAGDDPGGMNTWSVGLSHAFRLVRLPTDREGVHR